MSNKLIIAARNGDGSAFSELTEVYRPLIETMTDKYTVSSKGFGAEREDLRQEASLAFYRAVMTYDVDSRKVTFGLYAKICIRNRLISLVRKLGRRAKSEAKLGAAQRNEKARLRELPIDSGELITLSRELLSDRERRVFLSYADGKSYADIANELGITVKSVDNCLMRAKRKLRLHYGS